MRKIPFLNDHYYHVYNRGVDKRDVFLDKEDHYRFISYLIICNDTKCITNTTKRLASIIEHANTRAKLVDIVSYCLMPNHFHLLIKQRSANGIANFLKKLGGGYTLYFNKKYERSGVLFQGKTKNVLVETDAQLLHLSRYIHLNPKDINNIDSETDIENYPWSSLKYFTQDKSTPILSNTEIVLMQLGSKVEYKKFAFDANQDENQDTITSYLTIEGLK